MNRNETFSDLRITVHCHQSFQKGNDEWIFHCVWNFIAFLFDSALLRVPDSFILEFHDLLHSRQRFLSLLLLPSVSTSFQVEKRISFFISNTLLWSLKRRFQFYFKDDNDVSSSFRMPQHKILIQNEIILFPNYTVGCTRGKFVPNGNRTSLASHNAR